MPTSDDRGIGIKGWISGSKPKLKTEGPRHETAWDKHRIAILPFSNISPETKDEYFADGMTEELISTTSKISGLTVIARTSIMRYKGGQKSVSEVANELQVGTVLEGSVRKAGDKLRITVQLIDTQTSGHLWAESYDRELKDVFAIQSDISKTIAHTLKVHLLPQEEETIENKKPPSPESHTLYLKGRFHWNQRNKAALLRAVEYFEKAIQLEPEYALSYSGLADSYFVIAQHGFANPLTNFEKGRSFARKALELDENLPEAHATLAGISQFYDYDWTKAEDEFKRAIQLNPNYATAHQWYGQLLVCQERWGEVHDEIKKALNLDPLSLMINNNLAEYFRARKEYDLAEEQAKGVLEMDPNFLDAHWVLLSIYLLTTRFEDSSKEAMAISKMSKEVTEGNYAFALLYAVTGNLVEARKLVSGLEKMKEDGEYISPLGLADLSVLTGDLDNGFKWLERAYEERDGNLPYLRLIPSFKTVRSDPRYLTLLKKIGLQ